MSQSLEVLVSPCILVLSPCITGGSDTQTNIHGYGGTCTEVPPTQSWGVLGYRDILLYPCFLVFLSLKKTFYMWIKRLFGTFKSNQNIFFYERPVSKWNKFWIYITHLYIFQYFIITQCMFLCSIKAFFKAQVTKIKE